MIAIPGSMTAIEISSPGGPEVLRPAERPVPQPQRGEVLIKVAGAGLNGADLTQRQGRYPMPPGVTDIPGLEASGTVAALGADVRRIKVGEQVRAAFGRRLCRVRHGAGAPMHADTGERRTC